ncbi:MAG: PDZ domain-containing protein [Calditrichaeota bacterium]|nr:MAG: PDZ domain-containing protein [Calditrichota bacterium]
MIHGGLFWKDEVVRMKKVFILLLLFLVGASIVIYKKREPQSLTEQLDLAALSVQPASQEVRKHVNDQINSIRHTAITEAVAKVSNAVCGINVTQIREYVTNPFLDDPFLRYFFPDRIYREAVKSLGSGFLISENGFILTNEHVISNATEIMVTLPDGSSKEAKIVGADVTTDIALLKIDGDNYPYIRFGNSDDVIIGEWVIALGNPFGLFEINAKPTVTVGVVSAVDRDFGRLESNRVYQDMIQTDAAINQGNSGGPLVNSLGEVIGMNTFIYTGSKYNTGSVGIGFAIPINRIKRVLKELKEYGEVVRTWRSGLEVDNLTPLMLRYFGVKHGVIVTNVEHDSPAERAGLEVGDIIIEVNGKKISRVQDIWQIIEESDIHGGDILKLKVYRNGTIFNTNLQLERVIRKKRH